jgi:DNA helicase II / ATP-dependent DNA helicase PcrA
LNEMAVLYRSHFHALELQLEFTRRNIPFTITSGIRFFEQAHIKDVAAFIKLLANPADEISFKRIIKLMPGIGNKAADKLWSCFALNFLDHENGPSPVARTLQACANSVPKKSVVAWAQFTATFAQMEPPEMKHNPARLLAHLIEALYEDYAKENFTNYTQRLDELDQLGNFARGFEDTNEFLSQLALLTNMEAGDDKPKPESDETIKLTTIHQAKGLEFDAVFVVMLCEGMFPSARSLELLDALEEERRLFYVAVTRARKYLHLSYPITRNLGNSNGLQFPSRFLKELPDEVCEEWNLRVPGGHEPF